MSQKANIYKWGSVGMLAVDVLMVLLCPFYAVASEVASLLGGGAGLINELLGGAMSDSTSKLVEEIGSGDVTLLQAQKALYSLCNAFSSYSDELKAACTILTVFMIVIYAFLAVCVFEAVMHVLGKKLNGLALIMDVVMSIMAALLVWEVNGSFQQYTTGDMFHNTVWSYIIMILPLLSMIFWRKSKKLQTAGASDSMYEAGTNRKPLIDFAKWKAYLGPNKVAAIIIACVYVLEILLSLVGATSNPACWTILWMLIGLTVGIAVLYAYSKSYTMLKFLAIVSIIGGFFTTGVFGYGAISFLFRAGFAALTALFLYEFSKRFENENKLLIMAGITAGIDLILLIFSQYISVYTFVYFILELIGMAVPVVLFITAPQVLRDMKLMPVIMVPKRAAQPSDASYASYTSVSNSPRKSAASSAVSGGVQENPDAVDEVPDLLHSAYGQKMVDTFKKAASSAPVQLEIQKKINANDKFINQKYVELGQLYCLSNPSKNGLDPAIASAIDQVGNLMVANANINDQIEHYSNNSDSVNLCPKCGQENDKENMFCVNCGEKLEAGSAAASETPDLDQLKAQYQKNNKVMIGLFIQIGKFYYGKHEVYYKQFGMVPATDGKETVEKIIRKKEENKKLQAKLKEAEEIKKSIAIKSEAPKSSESNSQKVSAAMPQQVNIPKPQAALRPRFCTKCGFELEPNSRFCSECGAPVEEG